MSHELRATPEEAGRELDALIAERVMGATWENVSPAGRKKRLVTPEHATIGYKDSAKAELMVIGYGPNGNLPAYSTDIAAAWLVVEKMRERFSSWQRFAAALQADVSHAVPFTVSHSDVWRLAQPVNICHAALLACAPSGEAQLGDSA